MASWFTEVDKLQLRSVSEPLHWESLTILRAQNNAYEQIGIVSGRMLPPGVARSEFRVLAPHLRGVPLGTVEVKAGDAVSTGIKAKDRLQCSTQNNRMFEVVAPVTGLTVEIRRKLVVREIFFPERVLYLALRPAGVNVSATSEFTPELVRVLPVPFLEDVSTQIEGDSRLLARLKEIKACEIAREFLTGDYIARLQYCLVLLSNITPTAAGARDRLYPRYVLSGSPEFDSSGWASDYPWTLMLQEER